MITQEEANKLTVTGIMQTPVSQHSILLTRIENNIIEKAKAGASWMHVGIEKDYMLYMPNVRHVLIRSGFTITLVSTDECGSLFRISW